MEPHNSLTARSVTNARNRRVDSGAIPFRQQFVTWYQVTKPAGGLTAVILRVRLAYVYSSDGGCRDPCESSIGCPPIPVQTLVLAGEHDEAHPVAWEPS